MNKLPAIMTIIVLFILSFTLPEITTAKSWSSFSNIAIDKEWSVKFNQHIDPTSVAGNAYITQDGTKIMTTTSVVDNVLFVKPMSNLQQSTSYTLVVTNNLRDKQGKYINSATQIPFTTVAAPSYKTFHSEYDMTWNMASSNYSQFYLTGRTNAQDVGGYETRKGYTVFDMKIGEATRTTVQTTYGQPVTAIKKGNTNYKQNYKDTDGNVTSGTYLINNYYVTFFYDIHKNNVIRSMNWASATTETTKPGFFRTNTTNDYRASLEETMVHLINQARVVEGLNALIYTPEYNEIGRKHSVDMVKYNYFSHTDRSGGSARDRMNAGGLTFSWYGENLAYGQYSAIHAHEALMNSAGHRENILRSNFTHVLVGVAFTNSGSPYFTINFYQK